MNANTPPSEALVSRTELCRILQIHPETARRWQLSGRLPFLRLSSHVVRYRRKDLDRLVSESLHTGGRQKPGPKPKAQPQPSS